MTAIQNYSRLIDGIFGSGTTTFDNKKNTDANTVSNWGKFVCHNICKLTLIGNYTQALSTGLPSAAIH